MTEFNWLKNRSAMVQVRCPTKIAAGVVDVKAALGLLVTGLGSIALITLRSPSLLALINSCSAGREDAYWLGSRRRGTPPVHHAPSGNGLP